MIVIVDERELVTEGFNSLFDREGVASAGFAPPAFDEWVSSAAKRTEVDPRFLTATAAKARCHPPLATAPATVIALRAAFAGKHLRLFESGVDDVVRKPVHIREILARITAIRRRAHEEASFTEVGAMRIFMDGRDPEINGEPLPLPRRERRILEFLAGNRGRRVTKTQVFNAIYGIFDEEVEENVVESHISKLRKKLRERLGHDPIDSKRFLGYRLVA